MPRSPTLTLGALGGLAGLDMIKGECYWQHSAVTITCAVVHVLSRKSLLTILEVFPEVKATVARNSVRRKLLRALRLYIHQVQAIVRRCVLGGEGVTVELDCAGN